NDKVRGLIPSSERSSSQNRRLPSARSRIRSSVHLPEMISAVRQTGHRELLIALICRAKQRRRPSLLASASIAPRLHFVKHRDFRGGRPLRLPAPLSGRGAGKRAERVVSTNNPA